jgi:hypothetical protein
VVPDEPMMHGAQVLRVVSALLLHYYCVHFCTHYCMHFY